MSPDSSDASMPAVAVPAPLRPTLLAVDSCTRQHANLLVLGQIVSGLVSHHGLMEGRKSSHDPKHVTRNNNNNEAHENGKKKHTLCYSFNVR
jgi:hypothetical protein